MEEFLKLHGRFTEKCMVFKDCKVQEIVSFLLRFQGDCTRLYPLAGRVATVLPLYHTHTLAFTVDDTEVRRYNN